MTILQLDNISSVKVSMIFSSDGSGGQNSFIYVEIFFQFHAKILDK